MTMREKQQDPRQLHADAVTLRKRAEEQAESLEQTSLSAHTPEEIKEMFHELRVHQIELEMQNEELRTAQMQIEDGRARYYDLYDLAPVGYCTISEKGIILEANLTLTIMLGVNRHKLKGKLFSSFIQREDQDIYYQLRQTSFDTGKTTPCELRMVISDKTIFWGSLQVSALQNKDGTKSLRVAISDFSKQKMAEQELRESEEQYRLLTTQMQLGLALHEIICDDDGTPVDYRFIYTNDSFEKVTGLCKEDILGKTVLEVLPNIEKYWIDAYGKVALTGNSNLFENYAAELGRYFRTIAYSPKKGQFAVLIEDITDQKKKEEAIRKSEEKFRQISESINEVFWLRSADDSELLYINPAYEKVWGKTCQSLYDHPQSFIDSVYDLDRPAVFAEIEKQKKSKEFILDYRIVRPDGMLRWVNVKTIPVKNHVGEIISRTGIAVDITEYKSIEEQLKNNLKDLMESQRIAHLGTWRLDLETNHVVWSEELYRMFGFDPSLPVPDYTEHMKLFTPESWDQLSSAIKGTRTTGIPYVLELEMVIRDGSNGWMWVRGEAETNSEGRIIAIWGAAQNITAYKAAEKELIKAKENAVNADAAKSQFLSNMSHEIRTPMNGFMGVIQLMQTTELTEEQQNYLRIAKASTDRLLNVIHNILEYSRIEVGKIQLEKTTFSLRKMICDAIDLFKVSTENIGLRIDISIENDVPEHLVGDSFRLNQIMSNLIGNAVKFTQKGSIIIDVKVASRERVPAVEMTKGSINIDVKNSKVQNNDEIMLKFVVKDTGIGIPLDKVDSLFQRFSQVNSSTTRVYGGSGLGLSICKGLVEKMGGEIWVESIEGEGSSFYFTCVFEKAVEQIDFKEPITAVMQPQERKDISILIVEDDAVCRTVVEKFATRKGWKFTIAENGKQAIDIFKLNSFDIVLLDVQMPVMNGYETTGVFRGLESLKETYTPIIAMTAFALKGDREKCLEAGMDDYLSKPVDIDEFYAIVEKWTK